MQLVTDKNSANAELRVELIQKALNYREVVYYDGLLTDFVKDRDTAHLSSSAIRSLQRLDVDVTKYLP